MTNNRTAPQPCPKLTELVAHRGAAAIAKELGLGTSTVSKYVYKALAPRSVEMAAALILGDKAAPANASKERLLIVKIAGHDYGMVKELVTRMGGRVAFIEDVS